MKERGSKVGEGGVVEGRSVGGGEGVWGVGAGGVWRGQAWNSPSRRNDSPPRYKNDGLREGTVHGVWKIGSKGAESRDEKKILKTGRRGKANLARLVFTSWKGGALQNLLGIQKASQEQRKVKRRVMGEGGGCSFIHLTKLNYKERDSVAKD